MAKDQSVVPIVEYDHRDEESHASPWERWKRMRHDHPVVYSDVYGGFYALTRYRDLADASRNPEVFSSAIDKITIPSQPTADMPPIHCDPPEARPYREIINPYFSPAKVAGYEAWMQETVADAVDPLLASTAFDLPRDLGVPLSRQIILEILGLANAPAEVHQWTSDLILEVDERASNANENLVSYLSAELDRRRNCPGDGVFGAMITQRWKLEDRTLRDDEILGMTMLLLTAGLETTSSALSAAVCYLIDHPEAVTRLAAEPKIWGSAMEEFVRWSTPVTGLARTTRYDTEVAGCPIPAGAHVMLLYGSGNRDERAFPDPDEVILDRFPNRHLAFGMGPHRCAGSHLAKAQMRLTIKRMLPSLGDWCIEDPAKIRWSAGSTRGMSSVPLVRK